MTIAAEVQRIRDLFGPGTDIRVPPFQRAYAWEDKEVEALIKDLLEAFRTGTVYFLGAIVVIRQRKGTPSDVVDGQQRLTTLTIMMAVLRDMAKTREDETLLQSMIGSAAQKKAQRLRITLNPSDSPFFLRFVQDRKGTLIEEQARLEGRDKGSASQTRLSAAISVMTHAFSEVGDEARSRFAAWLLEKVSVVRVRVSEYSVAYKVFQALNYRQKPLADHDILKSALFDRAGYGAKEAAEQDRMWTDYGNRLGERGFADMWKQIRSIYDREAMGEMVPALLAAFPTIESIVDFLEVRLPVFVDAYETLVNGNVRSARLGPEARRRICFLRSIHHESWRAPAIRFLAQNTYDEAMADRFFWGMDRLAYTMQYAMSDRDYRHRRYRRLMISMDTPGALFEENSPLELTQRERTELTNRLRGRFPVLRQRKALLMRVCAAVEGGDAIDPLADCTVEHILPKAPGKGSEWHEEWSRTKDRDELTECLGNFTLLTDAENQEADTKPFTEKLAIYFRSGHASFPLSNDLRGRTRWTPEDVRARRDALIQNLTKDWNL